ncbi:MAG: hypothetical protein NC489_20945, partial [Ruminococcus flavefaciens]|nr:hypothetical protein [Ruminococcus flavefaciens]
VYEHTMADFEFNSKKIIKHYRKHYGDIDVGMYTLGQSIKFRVSESQEEPYQLPLFKFLVNYTMLLIPVECGVDLTGWHPWEPDHWTADGWAKQIDKYIEMCQSVANMRKICECIEMVKYLMNLWCVRAGDRQGLSISNNDFIEVMKRDPEALKSITCTFPIPDDISPTDLEKLTMDRTHQLLKTIGDQIDLPISAYARNNLFNPAQFREYAVHLCFKPDLSGNTIPYTYPTNVMMGLSDIRAFAIDAHGGRKAEITKLNVSDAGTLERALMMMMAPVKHVDINYECDSQHFRTRYVSSKKDLAKLEGRVALVPGEKDKYFIIDPDDTSLIGQTLKMKSPITCTHPRRKEGYICAACYGMRMARLNCDVHIGRLAAAESADEMEQKLLSAKHALKTDTVRVEFDDTFYRYFTLGNGTISLSHEMIEASYAERRDSDFNHLYLEFYPHTMGKHQDGESRHFDRSFQDIVIYDDRDESRITISEINGAPLYLSPEFNNECFLPATHYKGAKDAVRIPFGDIADAGEPTVDVLFEFSYRNKEIAGPLMKLESIMFNRTTINSFGTYDKCLDELSPLFLAGGIYIPDYQTELLVSQMITTPDGGMVDWNDPHPEYVFNSINKSIQNNPSALTSVLYRESGAQIAGAYRTYDKSGTSAYDRFIMERGHSQWS